MTLLSMLQDVADEVGIPRPSAIVGNTSNDVRQLLAIANREGKSLAQRYPWQESVKEATFTTVAAELQGTLESIAPGFNWDLYETMWNRDQQVPVNGGLLPQEWQFLKSSVVSGPYSEFRIRDKNLYMYPAPTAGETVAFEYVSTYWCSDSTGATSQNRWAADDDIGILPEDLMTIGIVWRWKKAKELDYSEEFRDYEMQVSNRMARSGGARTIDLSNDCKRLAPAVIIPVGNWNL